MGKIRKYMQFVVCWLAESVKGKDTLAGSQVNLFVWNKVIVYKYLG